MSDVTDIEKTADQKRQAELANYEQAEAKQEDQEDHVIPSLQVGERRGRYIELGRIELQDHQYIDSEKGYEFIKAGDRPIDYPSSVIAVQKTDFKPAQSDNTEDDSQPKAGEPMLHTEYLMPPVIVNLRQEAWAQKAAAQKDYQDNYENDPGLSDLRKASIEQRALDPSDTVRNLLSDFELNYFKKWGNNCCIFIHGFNVPFGHFGEQVFGLTPKEVMIPGVDGTAMLGKTVEVTHLPFKGTLYNSVQRLSKKYPPLKAIPKAQLPEDLRDDQKLNGCGAHNWFVHMENNLNVATGEFEHNNYLKFTRCLNVAWSGDVDFLDYMQCIKNGTAAGKKLVPLLNQLIDAGIEINIIAHSAGNQVLMSALNELGKQGKSDSIEHVFMWEAAIPDDSFSSPATNQNPSGLYRFPEAYKVPKKITILYSNNDGVLGEAPKDQDATQVFEEKMDDPNAGIGIALLCAAIKLTREMYDLPNHLESVYNVANMLGIPFSTLINDPDERERYYQELIAKHPQTVNGRLFEASLQGEIAQLQFHYPHALFNLTVAIRGLSSGWTGKIVDALGWLNAESEKYTGGPAGAGEAIITKWVWEELSQSALQAAAVFLSVMIAKGAEPRPAMGYSGADVLNGVAKRLFNSGLLANRNQTPWLHSHSGMKIPNIDMMNHVYKIWIWGEKGMKKFGRYTK